MDKKSYKIVVFQEDGSGEYKIAGITVFGEDIEIERVFDINSSDLPDFIDDPENYLSEDLSADLVLNFIKHPDLSEHLVKICKKKNIPVISSGKNLMDSINPPTCCSLQKDSKTGKYGTIFGKPEFKITVRDNVITSIEVKRGAPCGATWMVAKKLIGMTKEDALSKIGRETQYICMSDPSDFDPISGKSPLHIAGDVHIEALKEALKKN